MHSLYFVRIKQARDTSDAIAQAVTALEQNHFADGCSFFCCSPKADWYVVGGRWSGVLTELMPEGKRALAEIRAMLAANFPQLTHGIKGVVYGSDELRAAQAEASTSANSIYSAATGFPYIRDVYRQYGYPDDAQVVTPELLAALRASEKQDVEICFIDADGRPASERLLGDVDDADLLGFWLVVIDYHI
jgi:hypothetical protein